jgi:redox-sensitive bicupin YhaK (pirin superfamily)
MIKLRKSDERGYAHHGWLESYHSFSFAGYYDPEHMGWGNLRVINDDRIAAGSGFGKHSHKNMEIVTYVLAGQLAHEDSMGNVVGIPPGDVQRMSAGTGVTHSEFNHAKDQETHLLQIWIEPNVQEIPPSYEQKTIPEVEKLQKLRLIASPTGENGAVKVHANANIYAGIFDGGVPFQFPLNPKRKAYLHLIKGQMQVNGLDLSGGDALLMDGESELTLIRGKNAEVLLFELDPA